MMNDLVGQVIHEGDTVVHISNSAGSIWGNRYEVESVEGRRVRCIDPTRVTGKVHSFKPNRLVVIHRDPQGYDEEVSSGKYDG